MDKIELAGLLGFMLGVIFGSAMSAVAFWILV